MQAPLQIGPVAVKSRVMLAPMAGVTDVVFRGLVRHWAPDSLICTEMISSNGLIHAKRSRKADLSIIDKVQSDHPIAYQLSAHQEDVLLEAARTIVAEKNPDTLDLNMGCPVKKITGNFEGCSLMKEPERAHALISALVREVDKPVTVKFRLGWDLTTMNYREFGQMCQDAGAQMVTLHARTRSQGYQPGCKWDAFGELKAALRIPVIANGDINTLADARHIMDTYGVDGVMIGRGCMGQPWLIGHIDHALRTGETLPEPTLEERFAMAEEHARLLCDYRGDDTGIREMRKHLTWYVKGFPGASGYRNQLTAVTSLGDIQRIFAEIRQGLSLPLAV